MKKAIETEPLIIHSQEVKKALKFYEKKRMLMNAAQQRNLPVDTLAVIALATTKSKRIK